MLLQQRLFQEDYTPDERSAIEGRTSALLFGMRKDVDRIQAFVLAVRAARQDVGLTKDELAELAGMSPFALNRIELGEQLPTIEQARALSDALDAVPVTADQLRDDFDYQEDEAAQYGVDSHPDGLTGEQVAELLRLSPSAVDVAQASALETLRTIATQDTAEGADVREWMGLVEARLEAREARESNTMAGDEED